MRTWDNRFQVQMPLKEILLESNGNLVIGYEFPRKENFRKKKSLKKKKDLRCLFLEWKRMNVENKKRDEELHRTDMELKQLYSVTS